VALDVGRAEALRPSQQDAVVDALLVARVREGEAERDLRRQLLAVGRLGLLLVVVADERGQALGAEVKQALAVGLLLLVRELVLGLRDREFALALEVDQADAQVGAAKVDGEVLADLLAGRPAEDLRDQSRGSDQGARRSGTWAAASVTFVGEC